MGITEGVPDAGQVTWTEARPGQFVFGIGMAAGCGCKTVKWLHLDAAELRVLLAVGHQALEHTDQTELAS